MKMQLEQQSHAKRAYGKSHATSQGIPWVYRLFGSLLRKEMCQFVFGSYIFHNFVFFKKKNAYISKYHSDLRTELQQKVIYWHCVRSAQTDDPTHVRKGHVLGLVKGPQNMKFLLLLLFHKEHQKSSERNASKNWVSHFGALKQARVINKHIGFAEKKTMYTLWVLFRF